jgi:hypothetical protein
MRNYLPSQGIIVPMGIDPEMKEKKSDPGAPAPKENILCPA